VGSSRYSEIGYCEKWFRFLAGSKRQRNILVAGCGGGFDVFAGVPLAQHLITMGRNVVFANFSFTNLWLCGGEQITPTMWRVDQESSEIPYFPEKWLAEWLTTRGQAAPIYAFAKSGVRPLSAAYDWIIDHHQIDLVLLIDGGTDSILFGDEPGLGSVVEDAVSIVAVDKAAGEQAVLAAIGFGVDHYHGVSHHAFLENVARLTSDGGFLGAFSLTRHRGSRRLSRSRRLCQPETTAASEHRMQFDRQRPAG
jgi:hypothetical protein